jgi:hypothetical protein
MSKIALRQHFLSFVGNGEARVAVVADAIVAAVVVAAVHGTQSPLADALVSIATIKGQARAVLALREGIAATGMNVTSSGKVAAKGLTIGKMAPEKAQALADAIGDAFTVAASTVLTASVEKAAPTAAERAGKALAVLVGLTTRELRAALKTNDGASLLAQIALAHAEAMTAAKGEPVQPAKVDTVEPVTAE